MTQLQTAPRETTDTRMDFGQRRTIYASFSDVSFAEKAVGALIDFGVRDEDISLVARKSDFNEIPAPAGVAISQNQAWQNDGGPVHTTLGPPYSTDTRLDYEEDDSELTAKTGISTTTPADVAAGAAKGAGIGLGLGIAAALASIFIPGLGLVVGGGALALALGGAAGATAAGAVAGGVTGYLKDQGISDDAIASYTADYEAGGAILGVTVTSNNVDETTAQQIISKYGGDNITKHNSKNISKFDN